MGFSRFAREIVTASRRLAVASAAVLVVLSVASSTACSFGPKPPTTTAAVPATISIADRATRAARALQDIEIEAYRFAVSTQADEPGDGAAVLLAKSQRRLAYADAHVKLQGAFKTFYGDTTDAVRLIGDLSRPYATRDARARVLLDEANRLADDLVRQLPLSDGLRARVDSKIDLLSSLVLLLSR